MHENSRTKYRALLLVRMAVQRNALRCFNLFNRTGYVMYHQFNIQQLYVLPKLFLCVLYLSENKERLVPLTA